MRDVLMLRGDDLFFGPYWAGKIFTTLPASVRAEIEDEIQEGLDWSALEKAHKAELDAEYARGFEEGQEDVRKAKRAKRLKTAA